MAFRFGMMSGLALIGAVVIGASSSRVAAQGAVRSAQTDTRWYPFLGCWASDTTGGHAPRAGVNCIVPVSGSAGVESLSLMNGKIISRRRIDATGRTQAIDNQGCSGNQVASWSGTGRRVYLRAEYTCNTGVAGTSESMFALAPNGEMLQIEDVRAGSSAGGIVNVDKRYDAGIPAGLPTEAAAALENRQLSIATSRASAARPLTTDDVLDALRHVDAPVVRNWIYETGQRFDLSASQITALAKADVPSTVLQVMMGNAPTQEMMYADTSRGVPVYRGALGNTPSVYQPEVTQPVVTQPSYTPYPYSEYNVDSWNGFYYPVPLYYPYSYYYYPVPTYQRPEHFYPRNTPPRYNPPRPPVGTQAPVVSGYPHSAPYHPSHQPTEPVTRIPPRHRP